MSNTLIIKPTSACNFNCSFCSAKKLNIPIHTTVPQPLKEYIIKNKPSNIIITGGEPFINPVSYYQDLLSILDYDYSLSITSNMVLWYENPEKWDWLCNNPRVGIDTSFQYGDERKDDLVYTEERFKEVFWAFYKRYGKKIDFISVISNNNAKYAIKTVELAKELDVWVKLNCQLPVGLSTEYFPRYKLLEIYLELIRLGLDKYETNLIKRKEHICSFVLSPEYCKTIDAAYVNDKEELVLTQCEEVASSEGKFKIEKGYLFKDKCLACPLCRICNGCSVNRIATEPIKEEHCKWMKEHYTELKQNELI